MILIQNAHIKPIVGPELPNGCLLAEDGRITAVAPTSTPRRAAPSSTQAAVC